MRTRRGIRDLFSPRPRALLAGLAVSALTLTACGGGGSNPAKPNGNEAPKPGGTLRLAISGDPITLNPRGKSSGDEAMFIIRQLFDSLVRQNPSTGAIEPWLAESWTVNTDATSYTFHLRDGVTFSDGTALTAQVVKDNFDDIAANTAQENPQIVSAFASYRSATVVDPRTVTVQFERPNSPFLSLAASTRFGVISPNALRQKFEQRDTIAGTGPFVLKSYAKNADVVLDKRMGYAWPASGRAHTGDAYLDEVKFVVIPEASVRTGSLATKSIDAMSGLLPAAVKTVKRNGAQVLAQPKPGTVYGLMPLVNVPPLDDPAVRRAIGFGVNRQEIVDTVLSPEFKTATSPLASTTPGFVDLHDLVAYNPQRAEAELDAAGWHKGPDGIRTKGGAKLSLSIGWFDQFSNSQQALELIQSQLAKIGVQVNLVKKTAAEIVSGLAASQFDYFWYAIGGGDGDVLRTAYTNAPPNYLHRNDPELQALLQQQAAIQDPAQRSAALAQAQRHILEQGLVIPVFEETALLAASPAVHALAFDADAHLDQLYDTWLS
ncbi:ABC transporter substrate-binding protein [Yinghuangia aomiensis]|uniref:ABC transporter substrate-binding protein n=1 Tax=Yinghuangia aomiensis TaxID=676205 RepID=A0ABP9HVB7_9ACTN